MTLFKFNFFAGLLACAVGISSCSHEYPEDNEDYCIGGLSKVHKVSVHIDITDNMIQDEPVVIPEKVRSTYATPRLRYTAVATRPGSNEIISKACSTEPDVELKLPIGKVEISAWVDYAAPESTRNTYYFNDVWNEILVYSKDDYQSNNRYKAAFWGKEKFALTATTSLVDVKVSNATALLEVYATDDKDAYAKTVQFQYSPRVPAAINGFTGKVSYWWADCGWKSDLKPKPAISTHGILLGYDYIPTDEVGNTVKLKVTIRDSDGNILARKMPFEIPIKRGHITTVKAPFFSILEEDPDDKPTNENSGIGIDPSYNPDVIITLD